MSTENENDGYNCYTTGTAEQRQWFAQQWKEWPTRVDQRFTTNISFLYGGVNGYRLEHCEDPVMSKDFESHVIQLDRFKIETTFLPEAPSDVRVTSKEEEEGPLKV